MYRLLLITKRCEDPERNKKFSLRTKGKERETPIITDVYGSIFYSKNIWWRQPASRGWSLGPPWRRVSSFGWGGELRRPHRVRSPLRKPHPIIITLTAYHYEIFFFIIINSIKKKIKKKRKEKWNTRNLFLMMCSAPC